MAPIESKDVDKGKISFIRIGFFQAIGTMSFAFVCHHNSFIVYNSLKNNSAARWKIVSQMSVGISVVLSLILSVVAYLCFRDTIQSNALRNFPYDNIVIS